MEVKIEQEEGRRLDEVLFSLGAGPTRSKVEAMIKDGKVTVNGKVKKPSYRVKKSDIVNYQIFTEQPLTLEPEDIPLDIIFEDDDIIVVNKQKGLVVHPGNGNSSGTLVNALLHQQKNLAKGTAAIRPGIVHRIDKDTSGLLVVAKNDEALRFLQAQLADHSMHREYIALVKGIIDENDAKIDAPIGHDVRRPTRFAVNGKDDKEAITYFHVEERYPLKNCTLVTLELKTGRTHQIRVHMDYIGHPVIGDPLYGEGNCNIHDNGQLLHAYRLTLVHPKTKKEMSFEAPLPTYFKEVLDKLS